MRWYTDLAIGQSYFIVGFVDRDLTIPSIGTYVYLGVGALDAPSEGKHCFQDAYSHFAARDKRSGVEYSPDETRPKYIEIREESLDMVADRAGLVAWLNSPHSTKPYATEP